ncbi:hypothetical protein BU14_1696s0001 [Porphyra umbilicalis]|uniref:Uncharacterized protein n=1 Tax=Porphyra umbilicalis TaxID=2786 RepID=A0A1X6NKX6_PORUM|nr:hypothetical protein BU14_1696s0001 [Porphyra umbilicalis]|eukprot:OSX69247.1 hypothetical protein BU14_1696s0001 [Porphyra umbilicalis]
MRGERGVSRCRRTRGGPRRSFHLESGGWAVEGCSATGGRRWLNRVLAAVLCVRRWQLWQLVARELLT